MSAISKVHPCPVPESQGGWAASKSRPTIEQINLLAQLPIPPGERVVSMIRWRDKLLVATDDGKLLEVTLSDVMGDVSVYQAMVESRLAQIEPAKATKTKPNPLKA